MKIGPFDFVLGRGRSSDDQLSKEVPAELKKARDRLCRLIGYRFRNPGLLHEALRHPSAGRPNYDRLEFLGDSVLNLIISEYFYHHLGVGEGILTLARSHLVRGTSLTETALGLNLGESLDMGPQMKGNRQNLIATVAENALEALIGAVYLDGGLKAAKELVLRIFFRQDQGHRRGAGDARSQIRPV